MFILLVGKSSSVSVLFISDSLFRNCPVICRILYKIGIVYNFPSSSRTFETCGDPIANSKKKKNGKQNTIDCFEMSFMRIFLKVN